VKIIRRKLLARNQSLSSSRRFLFAGVGLLHSQV